MIMIFIYIFVMFKKLFVWELILMNIDGDRGMKIFKIGIFIIKKYINWLVIEWID